MIQSELWGNSQREWKRFSALVLYVVLASVSLTAESNRQQWQTDQLAAETSGNATIEGDDAAADTAIPTLNLKNYCQLMDRVAFVSNTQEAVKHYGRESEMAFQMAKRVKELKRKMVALSYS